MAIRRAVLGLAVALNVILLSLALPVNHGSAALSDGKATVVTEEIPLPPPPKQT